MSHGAGRLHANVFVPDIFSSHSSNLDESSLGRISIYDSDIDSRLIRLYLSESKISPEPSTVNLWGSSGQSLN